MQFIATTWALYGVAAAGDGRADRWNASDAIFSAANYLHSAGAPASYSRAIYAYNHAGWYVAEVLAWAARYRADVTRLARPWNPRAPKAAGGRLPTRANARSLH